MEKKKESRSGMEIMNLLQKEGRQRGTWNGKKDLGSRKSNFLLVLSIMSCLNSLTRVPTGRIVLELPVGMLDDDQGDFVGTVVCEHES
ncbi:hypothetical protein SLEP1_g55436 [Rubroshorea leprosula]|uniref:Uncharacterized protein n=1 Tax=Rubroshorea leprosula TaxID=152421 RepID=A0AAV5MFC5_9ROSI|nr:hypothetical protein SLEP1_g55436 [Rubroshorea leprosula]